MEEKGLTRNMLEAIELVKQIASFDKVASLAIICMAIDEVSRVNELDAAETAQNIAEQVKAMNELAPWKGEDNEEG